MEMSGGGRAKRGGQRRSHGGPSKVQGNQGVVEPEWTEGQAG